MGFSTTGVASRRNSLKRNSSSAVGAAGYFCGGDGICSSAEGSSFDFLADCTSSGGGASRFPVVAKHGTGCPFNFPGTECSSPGGARLAGAGSTGIFVTIWETFSRAGLDWCGSFVRGGDDGNFHLGMASSCSVPGGGFLGSRTSGTAGNRDGGMLEVREYFGILYGSWVGRLVEDGCLLDSVGISPPRGMEEGYGTKLSSIVNRSLRGSGVLAGVRSRAVMGSVLRCRLSGGIFVLLEMRFLTLELQV